MEPISRAAQGALPVPVPSMFTDMQLPASARFQVTRSPFTKAISNTSFRGFEKVSFRTMDPTVISASIAAAISLVVSFSVPFIQHKREEARRRKEIEEADRKDYASYRIPLQDAAIALRDRIGNIRERNFLAYLDTPRGKVALKGTLFRFAHYFGWAEVRLKNVERARLEGITGENAVDKALAKVAKALSSDRRGQAFMLWQDEQRAIGELMIISGQPMALRGFASFDEQYEAMFDAWMRAFAGDLRTAGTATNARLSDLQNALNDLIQLLEDAAGNADIATSQRY
jgi:hypothetical protein